MSNTFVLIFPDIGSPGRNSDGGIFQSSEFGQAFQSDTEEKLHLPSQAELPGTNVKVPYVLVADEAFPLKHNIMRPYPGRTTPGHLSYAQQVFNYRLSRARRIIENAFGILVARWRIFKHATITHPRKMVAYTRACVILHNLLIKADQSIPATDRVYCTPGFADGDDNNGRWRDDVENQGGSMMSPVHRTGSNNFTRTASDIRQAFCDYFVSDAGAVPWQHSRVTRGQ